MTRSYRFLASALLVCASCGSSKTKPNLDLVVTSFSPTADTEDPATPIKFQFDQPVVSEDEVGVPLQEVPVTIQPALEVAAHWADRQTLVLKPTALAPSTRYQVSLTGLLGQRAGSKAFEFVHRPLAVESVTGVDPERVPPKPDLVVRFNQPVRADEVAKRCKLVGKDSGGAVELGTADPSLVDQAVTVSSKSALEQGKDYELRCEKLGGAGGNVGMSEPYALALHTYPPFKVKEYTPIGDDIAPDEAQIQITFSTPVELEDIRKVIEIKPKVSGFQSGWLDDAGTKYTVVVNLDTTTEYTVKLPKGIKDLFQQTMAEGQTFSFTTGDAQPRLSMEKGVYAVEPGAEGYPVWTRNLSTFDVQCAVVPKARVTKVLTAGIDYFPYYDSSAEQALEWGKLGLKPKTVPVKIPQVKNKWHLTNLKLNEVCGGAAAGQGSGLFLAELRADEIEPDPDAEWRYHPRQRVLANVTSMGVVLKAGAASSLIWVTGLADGKPVGGAAVTVFSPEGKQVFKGTTGDDGLVRLPGTSQLIAAKKASRGEEEEEFEEEEYSYGGERLIAVIEKGSDLSVVDATWTDGLQTWNYSNVSSDYQRGLTRIRGFIQSDRGIYRPGETVHFKGIVRQVALGQAPRVPDQPSVAVTVTDSRGSTVYQAPAKLTPYGGFSFDLPLGGEASLGDYYVAAKIADQTFNERFMVEEFRKVTFELKLAADQRGRPARIGESLAFDVAATYLFGSPVARGKAEWTVQRRPHYLSFSDFGDFSFTDWAARGTYDWWYYEGSTDTSYVSEGDGVTDAKGHFKFAVRDPEKDLDGPQDYLAQITITDETDQSVSQSVSLTAHKTDFYLGLRAQEYVQTAGKPAGLELVAVGPDGKPVGAQAQLLVIRQTWECKHSEGYRTYYSCETKQDQVSAQDVTLAASGPVVQQVTPDKPGEYVVRLAGKDGRGNPVSASTYLWVVGKGEASWGGDDQARMSLMASQAAYEPGEVARLVPRTSLTGFALVTLERNGVIEASVRELASSGEGIEIPIVEAHAPNVFASVTVVRGRTGPGDQNRPRLQMGLTDLKVSSEAQRLKVEVATDKPIYEPGQDVTGTIKVSAGGQPVSAEVALSVADEGVLQLIAYQTPNPMKAFYAPWGLGVESATNWTQIARLNDPSEFDPDEGGDGGGRAGPAVRSKFVSSAYWAPSLMTDEKGEIRFAFKSPDNLTAFRLMAVAADRGSRFGSGDSRMTVRKPLLAQPVLPRFLSAGDQAEVGVVVHNYTGAAGTATVTATVEGVRLSKTEQTVQLPVNGNERVRFTGTVAFTREASLQFSVKMGAHSDALAIDLPVERPLVFDRKSLSRGALDNTSATVPVTWEQDILPRDSMLAISVDRTGMAELEGSLRYLVEYPYGCLEQTLSRTIPMVKVQDLAGSLDLAALRGPRLKAYIKIGVGKVIKHQKSDGHFSLWPDSEGEPHLTVYAMYGLNEARRSKIEVDGEAVSRGVAAMKAWVNEGNRAPTPDGDGATMAMAAYVLADMKQADAGLDARLFEARRGLPRYGQAYLLMALKLAGAPADPIDTLKGELLAAVVDAGETATVNESDDPKLRWYISSDVRSSAITLSALLMVDPQNPVIDKLAEGLKKEQRPGGYWENTQDNLYALIALADYARRLSKGNATVTITLDGKQVARKTLKGAEVMSYQRKLNKIKPGTIAITSQGPARYSVRLVTARKEAVRAAQDNGFAVTREYLDPQTDRPVKDLKAGQLIKIRVGVTTKAARNYVALVDPLPAGFEAVNVRLSTSQRVPGDDEDGSDHDWEPPMWVHNELRDTRALAFANRMDEGTHTFEYLARATLPGKFTAAPAHAEAMYEPEVYGRTGALEVTVKR